MAQLLLPVADIATGSWATTPGWSKVNDDLVTNPTGTGTSFDSEAVGNNTNTSNFDSELPTSGITDPGGNINHILRARWSHNQSGRTMQGNLELWQGVPGTGTLIATLQIDPDITITENTATYTLTGTEADNITDYNDLHLRLWGRGTSGGPTRTLVAEAIEFEIPDGGTAHTGTPTDDVDVTDSTDSALDAVRSQDDDADVTDDTSRIAPAVRVQSDDVGVTDAATAAKTIQVSVTDPVGVTDLVADQLTIAVAITDPVGATDSTTRVHDAQRTPVEAVAVADVISEGETNREQIVETVGVTDTPTRIAPAFRSVMEATGVTDSIAAKLTIAEEVTEPVGVTDSTPHVLTMVRSVTDDADVTDDTTPVKTIQVEIFDDVGVTDSTPHTQGGDKFETVTNPVGVIDSTSRVHPPIRSVVEPVGVTDQIDPAKFITVAIIESIGVTDTPLVGTGATPSTLVPINTVLSDEPISSVIGDAVW